MAHLYKHVAPYFSTNMQKWDTSRHVSAYIYNISFLRQKPNFPGEKFKSVIVR